MFLAIYLKISGTYQLSVISYQLSGVRSQLSGVRSQESGVRRLPLFILLSPPQRSGRCQIRI
ncbi:hypothetical protein BH695_1545 [Microcystis aeruginosa PCC 7806SL]|uniref:Uncharacterized protein n=1 Tax=Microcystis aeruginosa PCC 7806SL TaxID=1903187 RepID=A0AB33BVZ8_MICA7|nr:hypothetical protein BH695_1545 [Microcystis aeruginosa PCC 7806SL]